MQTFVNLHHHDEYSIRDGIRTVSGLVKLLKASGLDTCCVTNHGNVGGWIKQYEECKKNKIKSIFGMEAYQLVLPEHDLKKYCHLVLLAKNETGFYNIIKINNDAQINGFDRNPLTNFEVLSKRGKGIIGTSACSGGYIPLLLKAGKYSEAVKVYQNYVSSFDEFYIELTMIEMKEQVELNKLLIKFCQDVGGKLVVTLDSHYLYPEDTDSQSVLLAIKNKCTIYNNKWQYPVKNLYYRNEEQLRQLWLEGFCDHSENRFVYKSDVFTEEVLNGAIQNTRTIADSCENIKLDSTPKLPKLYDNAEEVLCEKATAGLAWRDIKKKTYFDRLQHELSVINKKGFADYFLIVEKIVSDTRQRYGEFSVGPGRGSAGGSLVSYALGITDVDPIKYDLLFSRFLDESREDMPDIDIDFEASIREQVKHNIIEMFGADHVCSIGTYQKMQTKQVLQNVACSLGYDRGEVTEITKKIDSLQGQEIENDDGETEEKKIDQLSLEEIKSCFPEIGSYLNKNTDIEQHVEVLRGQVGSFGKHAAGLIITNLKLTDLIPLTVDKKTKELVSQWVEGQGVAGVSVVGLVKFDILSLGNLTIIKDCVQNIYNTKGLTITKKDIPIDHKESISRSSKSDLVGIFQFENPSVKTISDQVQLESLNDIAILTSLIRPGPRDQKMDILYADRKHKREETLYYPECETILKNTCGIVVYQEQVMKVAQVIGGFSDGEANQFRKILSKGKDYDKIEKLREQFVSGAKKLIDSGKLTEDDANLIFDQLKSFAGYGFNASHAVCYGAITAMEFYLKHKFFIEYVVAMFNSCGVSDKKHATDFETTIMKYLMYGRKNGLKILGPDINKSKDKFTIEDYNCVRYPLSMIKNVGNVAEKIIAHQPYFNLQDFLQKMSPYRLNKRVFESLLIANCFGSFGKRVQVCEDYLAIKSKKKLEPTQSMFEVNKHSPENLIASSGRSCLLSMERDLLGGMILTRLPVFEKYVTYLNIRGRYLISTMRSKMKGFLLCRIEQIINRISKNNKEYLLVTCSDDKELFKFMVFSGDTMNNFSENFQVNNIGLIYLRKLNKDSDAFCYSTDQKSIVLE